jgi:hypothetical protein
MTRHSRQAGSPRRLALGLRRPVAIPSWPTGSLDQAAAVARRGGRTALTALGRLIRQRTVKRAGKHKSGHEPCFASATSTSCETPTFLLCAESEHRGGYRFRLSSGLEARDRKGDLPLLRRHRRRPFLCHASDRAGPDLLSRPDASSACSRQGSPYAPTGAQASVGLGASAFSCPAC